MKSEPSCRLLALLHRHYRLPYMVSRSLQYAKDEGLSRQGRIEGLLEKFRQIRTGLQQSIAGIDLPLPEAADVAALAALKPLEDCLDALICAWVGIEHLQRRTRGLGDSTSANWCPEAAFRFGEAKQTRHGKLPS